MSFNLVAQGFVNNSHYHPFNKAEINSCGYAPFTGLYFQIVDHDIWCLRPQEYAVRRLLYKLLINSKYFISSLL